MKNIYRIKVTAIYRGGVEIKHNEPETTKAATSPGKKRYRFRFYGEFWRALPNLTAVVRSKDKLFFVPNVNGYTLHSQDTTNTRYIWLTAQVEDFDVFIGDYPIQYNRKTHTFYIQLSDKEVAQENKETKVVTQNKTLQAINDKESELIKALSLADENTPIEDLHKVQAELIALQEAARIIKEIADE